MDLLGTDAAADFPSPEGGKPLKKGTLANWKLAGKGPALREARRARLLRPPIGSSDQVSAKP